MTDPSFFFGKMVRLDSFSTRYHAANLALDLGGIETVWPIRSLGRRNSSLDRCRMTTRRHGRPSRDRPISGHESEGASIPWTSNADNGHEDRPIHLAQSNSVRQPPLQFQSPYWKGSGKVGQERIPRRGYGDLKRLVSKYRVTSARSLLPQNFSERDPRKIQASAFRVSDDLIRVKACLSLHFDSSLISSRTSERVA